MRILETALYAEDLRAARQFYVERLGLEEVSFDPDRDLFLRVGDAMLIIFRASRTLIHDSGVPPHGSTGPGHMAFGVSREELDAWEARLGDLDVPIIEVVEWRNGAKSIYFKDPAGNILEFATTDLWFPAKPIA
jgi:catechol 2,3-dioxygenase-like lactoylglutathione lyase family enzyme